MDNDLIIELDYQKNASAFEDENTALRLVAKMFADQIIRAAKSDLGIPIEDEITDGRTEIKNT